MHDAHPVIAARCTGPQVTIIKYIWNPPPGDIMDVSYCKPAVGMYGAMLWRKSFGRQLLGEGRAFMMKWHFADIKIGQFVLDVVECSCWDAVSYQDGKRLFFFPVWPQFKTSSYSPATFRLLVDAGFHLQRNELNRHKVTRNYPPDLHFAAAKIALVFVLT